MTQPLSIRQIAESALTTPGGVTLKSPSKATLLSIRWKLYSFRRRDRTLNQRTLGGPGTSRFDTLTFIQSQKDNLHYLRVLKESDLFHNGEVQILGAENVVSES